MPSVPATPAVRAADLLSVADTHLPQAAETERIRAASQETVNEPPATQLLAALPIVRRRPAPEPVEVALGRRLGPYVLLRQIGRGPKGIVFEAQDVLHHRPAAVKVLAPEMAARGPAWVERFLQEARLASRLDHPKILSVLAAGQESGLVYCAMPLMTGGSAREALRLRGPFAAADATRVIRLAAEALAAAHARGLAHGNLKPSNLFLIDGATVKIADFAGPYTPADREGDARLRAQDVATDLRLLGATYHWLLTGRPPADYAEAVAAAVPPACARVIATALSRRRGYAGAAEMAEALAHAQESLGSTEQRFGHAPRPARRTPRLPEVGQVLGKCLLTERIGQGSAGAVFRARHQTLNIAVAVKVLHSAGDSSIYRQLRSEARLLAQLNHTNIVRVWDFEDDPQLPYLVLECVDGPSLADVLRQHGRVPAEMAARVVGQVAAGLAAAQRLGIVHRDVKPANILLTADGTAKLADLGLAMFVDQAQGNATGRGLAGTVAYMPPEQASATGTVDHRSDVYALGATFYHLVTGRIPFLGSTRLEVIVKHAEEAAQPPHELVPDLPPGFSDVILKMMAKASRQRYQGYDELAADLNRLAGRG